MKKKPLKCEKGGKDAFDAWGECRARSLNIREICERFGKKKGEERRKITLQSRGATENRKINRFL